MNNSYANLESVIDNLAKTLPKAKILYLVEL